MAEDDRADQKKRHRMFREKFENINAWSNKILEIHFWFEAVFSFLSYGLFRPIYSGLVIKGLRSLFPAKNMHMFH